jgi:hypothetical protein
LIYSTVSLHVKKNNPRNIFKQQSLLLTVFTGAGLSKSGNSDWYHHKKCVYLT